MERANHLASLLHHIVNTLLHTGVVAVDALTEVNIVKTAGVKERVVLEFFHVATPQT